MSLLGGNCMIKVDDSQKKQELITRLNRLEGQVRGIKQMITNDRDCDAILIQVSAIINSLKSFGNNILKDYLTTNLVEDIKSGKLETIEEVITLFGRIN